MASEPKAPAGAVVRPQVTRRSEQAKVVALRHGLHAASNRCGRRQEPGGGYVGLVGTRSLPVSRSNANPWRMEMIPRFLHWLCRQPDRTGIHRLGVPGVNGTSSVSPQSASQTRPRPRARKRAHTVRSQGSRVRAQEWSHSDRAHAEPLGRGRLLSSACRRHVFTVTGWRHHTALPVRPRSRSSWRIGSAPGPPSRCRDAREQPRVALKRLVRVAFRSRPAQRA